MRILIVEPHASGHHAHYLRWLTDAAVGKGWNVVIATTAAALSHPLLKTIAADGSGVETRVIEGFPAIDGPQARTLQLIRREFIYWRIFHALTRDLRAGGPIDAAVLPYVDYCFFALAILGSPFEDLPWCGISMRLQAMPPAGTPGRALPFKWRAAKRILRRPSLQALFVINPSVQDLPLHWLAADLKAKLQYLPDPAQRLASASRDKSRASLGIEAAQVVILVFGSLDARKGIDSLFGAVMSGPELDACVIILAGKLSLEVRGQLGAQASYASMIERRRLIVIDRILADDELNVVFAAADIVWVGYRGHVFMSGVLALAGRAGIPVLGTAEGEIGRLIAKAGIGRAARIDRPDEVIAALSSMLDTRTRIEMGQRARAAFSSHTIESFGNRVTAVLTQ
jgi:glycosyltransferase involved in cell wall biosynthesis